MAVVDLPDPTQPPPTVNHGSTDDLLSQLAGEEIDRLLADTDTDTDTGGDAAAAVAAPADSASRQQFAQAVAPPAASEPAASLNQISGAPTSSREEVPSAPVEAPADLASVLGPLAASANPNASSPPVVAPPAAAPATSSPPAPAAAPPAAGSMDSAAIVAAELEAADAERIALRGKAAPTAAKLDAGIDPDTFDLPDESAPALPMFLRPLEWLNAPFASSGDDTRESIGKVALITLVNAVGILIYVFFFRRR